MPTKYSIPRITAGQATTDKFNAPLQAIQTYLNDLAQSIDSASNKSAVVQWGVPAASDVQLGDLVYFDPASSLYKKAIAALRAIPGAQGQSVEAQTSRVQGMIIELNPAVLLRNGYYESTSILNTIGVGAGAGLYFLSPSKAGKATKDPGWNMRQPCISYYGDGKFSLITHYLAHDNHHHSYLKLTDGPHAASTITDTSIVKKGNSYWNVPTDKTGQLGQTTAVFINGTLNSKNCVVDKDKVWYTSDSDTKTNLSNVKSIQIFNVYPFAYGDSVVRSVASNTLDVSGLSGSIQIEMPQYDSTTTEHRDTAISSIIGKKLYKTPVVSSIQSGIGITVSNRGSGRYVLSASNQIGVPLQTSDVVMNGTQRVASTDLLTYSVFPSNATASLVISKFIQNTKNIQYKPSLWLTHKGGGTGTVFCSLYWVPVVDGVATQIPTSAISSTQISLQNTNVNTLSYIKKQTDITLNTSGTLIAKLQMVTPSKSVYLHKYGFILDIDFTDSGYDVDNQVDDTFLDNLEKVITYNANY